MKPLQAGTNEVTDLLLFDWLTSSSPDEKRARVQHWFAKYATAQDQLNAASAFIKYIVGIEQQEALLEVT